MRFKDLKEIIHFAIEKEKEAAAFYETISELESFSGPIEMFKEFAREEHKHRALLEKLEQGSIDERIGKYKFKWIPDLKRSDYTIDMDYKKGMSYSDILLIAMKREEKALKLYNDLLKQAQKEDIEKLFKILCQEEAKHKLALETLYDDFMAKMGD